jgi:transposase
VSDPSEWRNHHLLDPQAWLVDVLRSINDHPASRLDELLPWN